MISSYCGGTWAFPRKRLPAGHGQLVPGRSRWTPCETAGRTRAHMGSVQAVEAVVTGESLLPAGRKCPVGGVLPVAQQVCALPRNALASRFLSRQLEDAVRSGPSCEHVSSEWQLGCTPTLRSCEPWDRAASCFGVCQVSAPWRNTSRPKSRTPRLRL